VLQREPDSSAPWLSLAVPASPAAGSARPVVPSWRGLMSVGAPPAIPVVLSLRTLRREPPRWRQPRTGHPSGTTPCHADASPQAIAVRIAVATIGMPLIRAAPPTVPWSGSSVAWTARTVDCSRPPGIGARSTEATGRGSAATVPAAVLPTDESRGGTGGITTAGCGGEPAVLRAAAGGTTGAAPGPGVPAEERGGSGAAPATAGGAGGASAG
jgi:hypothetical protein